MAIETQKPLLQDANGNVLPQYWDATNTRYVVESNGDTSNVDFTKTALLTDPNGNVIPQFWDTVNSRWTAKTSSGGGSGGDGSQGLPGKDGKDGKTAYQVALDNGFVGSEQQWLDSLVGPEGPQGLPGNDGESFAFDDFTPEQLEALRGPQGEQGPPGADASLILPLPADDVSQTSELQFISGALKALVQTNKTDIESIIQRFTQLEQDLQNLASTDELVAGDANDTPGYLSEKIDGDWLKWIDGKLVIDKFIGLLATVEELNALVGVKSNVQAQLDAMLKVVNPQEIFPTKADLPVLPNDTYPQSVTVLVQSDVDHDGATTFYISTGTDWQYINKINSDVLRDFLNEPLNINTETYDVLSKSRYEKQNASETAFSDPTGTLTSSNTQDAILELLRLADSAKEVIVAAIGYPANTNQTFTEIAAVISNAKQLLTNYLIAKNVGASEHNSLTELVNKVPAIPSLEITAGVEKTGKINVSAPYTHEVVLNEPLSVKDVTASLIEFHPGAQNAVHYDMNFNSEDANSFISNPNVLFDGKLRINPYNEQEMVYDDNKGVYYHDINRADFEQINSLEVIPNSPTLIEHNSQMLTYREIQSQVTSTVDYMPKLTSNNSSPLVTVEAESYLTANNNQPWKVFNKTNNDTQDCWQPEQIGSRSETWIKVVFANKVMLGGYSITTRIGETRADPKKWVVEGGDNGEDWDVLQAVDNQVNWGPNSKRKFTFDNNTGYYQYRFKILDSTKHGGAMNFVQIALIELFEVLNISEKQWVVEQDVNNGLVDLKEITERKVQTSSIITMGNLIVDDKQAFTAQLDLTTHRDIFDLRVNSSGAIKLCNVGDYGNLIEFTSAETIYSTFGDTVEVVFIPNTNVSAAKLFIDVNKTPLDDLDGNFTVITSADNAPKIVVDALKNDVATIVYQASDISLLDVEALMKEFLAVGSGRIGISIDSGGTWLAYSNGWQTVGDASQGLTFDSFNALTSHQLSELLEMSNTIRFSYYLTNDTMIDRLTLRVNMQGKERLADTADYKVSYDQGSKTVRFDISKPGTYSINYVT